VLSLTSRYDTARIAAVNTPCIAIRCIAAGVANELETSAERLREARKDAGYDSAQDAADAFGWGASGYRHHENGTRSYSPLAAKKYARAFRVNIGWLLNFPGIPSRNNPGLLLDL
jgi:hypothetical protein